MHERVAKLEAAGVITGYHAAVAPDALGLGVSALVGILQSDRGDSDRIAEALRAMPEIEDCWFVAGEETFVVKVRVPDVPALEQTHRRAQPHPRRGPHPHHRRALDPLRGPGTARDGAGTTPTGPSRDE